MAVEGERWHAKGGGLNAKLHAVADSSRVPHLSLKLRHQTDSGFAVQNAMELGVYGFQLICNMNSAITQAPEFGLRQVERGIRRGAVELVRAIDGNL